MLAVVKSGLNVGGADAIIREAHPVEHLTSFRYRRCRCDLQWFVTVFHNAIRHTPLIEFLLDLRQKGVILRYP